ncbi:MAG: hypothetical protein ACTSYI_04800 [Promethearchaeota archaeon]
MQIVTLIIAHFILYAIPVFVAMSFQKSMQVYFYYTYLGVLFCLTQLLDNTYSLQLTSQISLNGGDIAYCALQFTAIILLISQPEPKVVRVLIYVILIISLFLFFFFLFVSYITESIGVINYLGIPGEFWSLSYTSILFSFILFSGEILLEVFLLKKIIPQLKRQWIIVLVIAIIYYVVLIIDGILFPLGTNILNPAGTHFSVAYGILAKMIFGGGFSLFLIMFLIIFPQKLSAFISVDFTFRNYLLPPKRRALVEKLNKAERDISELTKILPICAKCKKVRDDTGYWKQVEEYFSTHDMKFTHGLCPDCAQESFAEMDFKE